LRATPADLAAEYRARGWWDDTTVGTLVADGLAAMGSAALTVRSEVRPWRGTLGDLDRAARSLASALRARGVGPGDAVVLQLPNWFEAGVAFAAASYLGAVVVPVVHFYGPKEVGYILDVVEPDVIITADRFARTDHLEMYQALLADRDGVEWLVADSPDTGPLPDRATAVSGLLDGEPLEAPLAVDPDAPAVVGFTSGTTRNPKGVVHSHRSIVFEARQLEAVYPSDGPAPITGSPMGHFMGMLNALLIPLIKHQPVHLIDKWDPGVVLASMRAEGLGVSGGAPYFLTSLLDHPDFTDEHLALMPYAGLGGAAVPLAVTERAKSLGIKVFRSYGSTEHPSITATLLSDPEDKRLATDGSVLPGVEMRLDEEGQILSRGPDCFVGYTDRELTEAAFDADGWYHTGDVGVLDADGYLTISDRLSDVIIRGGENISALEVEDVLLGLDGLAEVTVVAAPDARLGEHAAAVVRVQPGAAAPSLDDVRRHMEQRGLARQKWPESLYVVDDFPRTPTGKVQKFRLRQQLRDGQLPD